MVFTFGGISTKLVERRTASQRMGTDRRSTPIEMEPRASGPAASAVPLIFGRQFQNHAPKKPGRVPLKQHG